MLSILFCEKKIVKVENHIIVSLYELFELQPTDVQNKV